MKLQTIFAASLTALILGGCAGNPSSNSQATIANQDQPSPSQIKDVDAPPISAETRFAAGQLAESRGDFGAAETQYKDVIKSDKKHARALYRLGCVYSVQRKFPQAIATWKQYLKLTNESAFAYSNLAFTEELAGLPQQAEVDYQHGIAKDPTNEPCRVNFGMMLARHGRIGEAELQLQAVLSKAEVHYNLAAVYELQHRKELAKLEYQKSLDADPTFVDAKEKLASLDTGD